MFSQEPTVGPTFTSGLQVCQVLQDGEWQRVPHAPQGFWHPLRRVGVRECESLAGQVGGQGRKPKQSQALKSLLRGQGPALTSPEILGWRRPLAPHLNLEGVRPALHQGPPSSMVSPAGSPS